MTREELYDLKCKAWYLCKQHPERVVVLYCCSHRGRIKENHHPDYHNPFDVKRLCQKCHKGEHIVDSLLGHLRRKIRVAELEIKYGPRK